MPEEARDTLVALFPVKQSAIKKGGDAWTVPCRALIRAQASPPPSPKQQRKSARITMGARSEESSGNSSDSSHLDEPEPPKKKASDGASAKLGGKEGSPPYLPSHALLAVLPPQRRAQLYLAEMWSTQTKAEREKHLERINSRQEGFGPGPGACHSELVPGELRSRAGRRLPRTRARRASVPGRAPVSHECHLSPRFRAGEVPGSPGRGDGPRRRGLFLFSTHPFPLHLGGQPSSPSLGLTLAGRHRGFADYPPPVGFTALPFVYRALGGTDVLAGGP